MSVVRKRSFLVVVDKDYNGKVRKIWPVLLWLVGFEQMQEVQRERQGMSKSMSLQCVKWFLETLSKLGDSSCFC